MYQVLARKYRPRNFYELVGQTHVSRALSSALERGRLHHAYLFTGTRGVGKTTIARILAKCLNCETGITATPCEVCNTCRAVNEGRFIDLIEIDAASRTKVEDTRELLDNVPYAPTQGRFKVYLIDEVHMLSTHSFNALLKTLEEPPEHVKFLFATTDPQKLPITVISRCLQFTLRPLAQDEIQQHLTALLHKENIEANSAAIWQIAEAAQGSLRDALSLTDQAIAYGQGQIQAQDVKDMLGLLDRNMIFALLLAIHHNHAQEVADLLLQMRQQALDVAMVLDQLIATLHELAMLQHLPSLSLTHSEDVAAKVRQMAVQIHPQDLQLYYQIACKGRADLSLAVTQQQGFEMCVLRLLAFKPLPAQQTIIAHEHATQTPQKLAQEQDATQLGADVKVHTLADVQSADVQGSDTQSAEAQSADCQSLDVQRTDSLNSDVEKSDPHPEQPHHNALPHQNDVATLEIDVPLQPATTDHVAADVVAQADIASDQNPSHASNSADAAANTAQQDLAQTGLFFQLDATPSVKDATSPDQSQSDNTWLKFSTDTTAQSETVAVSNNATFSGTALTDPDWVDTQTIDLFGAESASEIQAEQSQIALKVVDDASASLAVDEAASATRNISLDSSAHTLLTTELKPSAEHATVKKHELEPNHNLTTEVTTAKMAEPVLQIAVQDQQADVLQVLNQDAAQASSHEAVATPSVATTPQQCLQVPPQQLQGAWTLEKWDYWLRTAAISPALQELAQHALMQGDMTGLSTLTIAPEYENMLSSLQDMLQHALAVQFQQLQLRVQYAQPQGLTPFALQQQRKQAAFDCAQDLLSNDSHVQSFMQTFAASLHHIQLKSS